MMCKDCGLEMKADRQEQHQASSITIYTCKNRVCALWSVTLTQDVYESLNEDQLNNYRQIVANLKKTMGMQS